MISRGRLRNLGLIGVFAAFFAGVGTASLWAWSLLSWQTHLTQSYIAGASLYESLSLGTPMPPQLEARALSKEEAALANSGRFSSMPELPKPGLVTHISILTAVGSEVEGPRLTIGVVSDKLIYPVSQLHGYGGQTAADKLGQISRLLARYCSDSVMFAQFGNGPWHRVSGVAVWGCGAAPRDLRLAALLLGAVALIALGAMVIDVSSYFERFAAALQARRRGRWPESYSTNGPKELEDIVRSVNASFEADRTQIAKRAMVLSGVSHDLGTPATRLRLRAALIQDAELRGKLEADVDQMSAMIESVLSYSQAELGLEEPRQIALVSLVEALVDDYADMGRPVSMERPEPHLLEGGRSVFGGQQARASMPDGQPVLVVARPLLLERAISNLIDNALKYGRRAHVSLEADATRARIVVEDEGSGVEAEKLEAMIAPFSRGENTQAITGHGLGLTIVATVAEQHAGRLFFEDGAVGVRACLEIRRG